jgi:transcriptional regulator with XRE-family HTH domain
MLVQKLRLKRGWSQQQLAEASGLSVRTVQRIEAGQPASTETLKSLAAVFEVDFSSLDPQPEQPAMTSTSTTTASPQILAERQEAEAFAHVRRLRGFYMHPMRYVVIILGLWGVNLIVSPHRLWVLYVMGGWGIGLLAHAFSVLRPDWLLGPQWERRQVEKRLGRPL